MEVFPLFDLNRRRPLLKHEGGAETEVADRT